MISDFPNDLSMIKGVSLPTQRLLHPSDGIEVSVAFQQDIAELMNIAHRRHHQTVWSVRDNDDNQQGRGLFLVFLKFDVRFFVLFSSLMAG